MPGFDRELAKFRGFFPIIYFQFRCSSLGFELNEVNYVYELNFGNFSHSQIYRHNTRRRMLESDVLGGQNQSVSAGITPGWNDPPPLNATTTTALNGGGVGGGRLHLQRQRRPVDPSVQSAANFVQLGGSASPGANLQPPASSQHQQHQHFHQSRSFPQLHAAAVSASPLPAGPQPPPPHSLGIGTHPASAFSPTSAAAAMVAAPMIVHSQSQTMLSTGDGSSTGGLTATMTTSFPATQPPHTLASCAAAAVAATDAQMSLRLNHHLFSPPAPSMGVNLPHPGAAEPLVQQQHHIQTTTAKSPILAQLAPSEMAQQNTLSHHQSLGLSNGHHQPILFAPPNTVPIATDHHNHHHQSAVLLRGCVDLNRIPVKAAGDVSLNGLQLVVFLNKATMLLQPGPTREGIQLRFNQFGDLVQACQISEACLKKLNFVVDAIDRHVYDEAWQFFEQMVASFHNDCTIGGWAHGVRLLLQELRKHSSSHAPGRSHSAGTRLTH